MEIKSLVSHKKVRSCGDCPLMKSISKEMQCGHPSALKYPYNLISWNNVRYGAPERCPLKSNIVKKIQIIALQ